MVLYLKFFCKYGVKLYKSCFWFIFYVCVDMLKFFMIFCKENFFCGVIEELFNVSKCYV